MLANEQVAFVHRDSLDLTGFIDGTANPSCSRRRSAALVPDGRPGAGGSHVLAMRWVHDLEASRRLPVADQERVFGRTKADSIELEGDAKPPNAHIARVEIDDEAGNELPIYRRSVPYGTVAEHGLYFLAFSAIVPASTGCSAGCSGSPGRASRPAHRFLAPGQRRVLLRAAAQPPGRPARLDRGDVPGGEA